MLTFDNYVLRVKQVETIARDQEFLGKQLSSRLKHIMDHPITVKELQNNLFDEGLADLRSKAEGSPR